MPDSLERYLPASLRTKPEIMAFLALAGCISLGLVSIAASQILLAVAAAGYLWMRRTREDNRQPEMHIILPLLAFMLWNIIAALASPNPWLGLTITKKFYLYLLVALVPLIIRGEGQLTWIYRTIFVVSILSSLRGIGQFISDPHRDLLHRISGFMSHPMTYSGLSMLVLVLLTSYALYAGFRGHKWVIPVGVLIVIALVFSLTRNTWAGAVTGIIVLLILRRPWAIAALMTAILIFYLISPGIIKQRLQSGLDTKDSTTRQRIECIYTAMRMIEDHPWLGVGPKNVSHEALKYRREHEFPDWAYQHMHNNFLQIAAESGIPGLILWLWFMIRLAWDSLRCYRNANSNSFSGGESLRRETLMASSAAIAAWAALLIAGMLEYNFGDSEVLTLFLFITSAPYAFMVSSSKVLQPAAQIRNRGAGNSERQTFL
jgi:putative inorganic carbon (hco3(-)) transporter